MYRNIEKVTVNSIGNIVLHLKYGQNVEGSNTLVYITGDIGKNVLLDLNYTVTQEKTTD
ncbi:hypothetical protein [Leptotrichia sp. OH3620_COT-345]|uniref:hypothetical protein n=1 Tax=Leptotrichia sp. OH3620_COT-345 TaxID=2491048 RepID=UPI0013156353|nr:hypothetical protein [Leptotrichia sp. OH3620_COT-345]